MRCKPPPLLKGMNETIQRGTRVQMSYATEQPFADKGTVLRIIEMPTREPRAVVSWDRGGQSHVRIGDLVPYRGEGR